MKERLKDWRILATLSIIFFVLLSLTILDSWVRRIIDSDVLILIMAILFGLSFIGFLIFSPKKYGVKIVLSIFVCALALSLLSYLFMEWSGYYNYYFLWNDFCILCGSVSAVSLVALLLMLIRRDSDKRESRKN